jgi:Ca2+-binding RTX toxin-like protein
VNHTITGGSGNDTFDFGANFAAGDKVDGGAGTDTLAVTQAITAAQWAGVSNIETVAFTMGASVTQDASLLTGVTTFNTSGAFVQTLTKLAADAKVGVVGDTATLTAALADVTGLNDAFNLSLNTVDGTAAVTLGILTNVAGVEQINIVTNGNSNAVTNVITIDNVAAKHVITGAASLQLTNTLATVIDASGMTGHLTVSVGSAGDDNYQGGSGNDTLSGVVGNDVLVGNAGNDRLNGGVGNDTLKGGEGVDTFAFTGIDLNAGGSGTAQGVDHITDFVAGTDKIALVGNGIGVATPLASVTVSATAINVTTAADVAAIITAIGNSAAVSVGGNAAVTLVNVAAGDAAGTYLFINDGNAAASAGDDILINITGVSGSITANDFVFA